MSQCENHMFLILIQLMMMEQVLAQMDDSNLGEEARAQREV